MTIMRPVPGCEKLCYEPRRVACVAGWPDGSCGKYLQGHHYPFDLRTPHTLELGENVYAVRFTFGAWTSSRSTARSSTSSPPT